MAWTPGTPYKKQRKFAKGEMRVPKTIPPMFYGPSICPFCGASDLTTLPESDELEARTGCLTCNRWFTEEKEKRHAGRG